MAKRIIGLICMLLMIGAGLLRYENHREEAAAGGESAAVLMQLREAMAEDVQTAAAAAPDLDETQTDAPRDMPALGLMLPVMSDWGYERLRVAPCCWGSVYDDSLVILAHNYARHFGGIKDLEIGDTA